MLNRTDKYAENTCSDLMDGAVDADLCQVRFEVCCGLCVFEDRSPLRKGGGADQ